MLLTTRIVFRSRYEYFREDIVYDNEQSEFVCDIGGGDLDFSHLDNDLFSKIRFRLVFKSLYNCI
jgi:hypothetical protein